MKIPALSCKMLQKYTAWQKLQCKDQTGQIYEEIVSKTKSSRSEEQTSQRESEDEQ